MPDTFENTNFISVSFQQECPQLEHSYAISKLNEHMVDTLVVSFKGQYQDGAAGRSNAGFMKGMVQAGIAIWEPLSILIDLQEFHYRWGDDINTVFASVARLNAAILIGTGNRRGLSSLEFGINTREDLIDNDFFFDDFDKAIERIKKKE